MYRKHVGRALILALMLSGATSMYKKKNEKSRVKM